MEINDDQPNEKSKSYLFKSLLYLERESATITCILAETHRQAEELESLIVKKGKVSGMS